MRTERSAESDRVIQVWQLKMHFSYSKPTGLQRRNVNDRVLVEVQLDAICVPRAIDLQSADEETLPHRTPKLESP